MTATRKLAVAAGAVAIVAALGACSDSGSGPGQATGTQGPSQPQAGNAKHGPMFPECGGISDQTMAEQTRVTGLVTTAKNSIGCQWLAGGGILGPHFSFTWYRGSPIGRERKTEELSRTSVEDINIEGHSGFIAIGTDPTLGDNLCEVGIQFNDDFIEWSVSFAEKPFPPACDVAKELTRLSIVNAK
ncbi:LprB [Mycolicibacterium rhodesiae JS60]|nr:LprB [Mycolicibacterium rhodesiae JS60]